ALFTMLYRSTDRLSRRGAPVKNLAHSASFDSCNKNAPSKCGTKQLGSSSRVGRQMRLDLRKLRFRQPKLVATHLCLLFGSRESRHYARANTFMGPVGLTFLFTPFATRRLSREMEWI